MHPDGWSYVILLGSRNMYLKFLAVVAIFVAASTLSAQEQVSFSGVNWVVSGDARIEQFMGRQALRLRDGRADLDVDFSDGTIEFDVRHSANRGFFGIMARRSADGTGAEYFYIRPHQTRRFDSMQYTPITGGSAWQIYAEYNAEADWPVNEWYHVKLVFQGDRLEVFVKDQPDPSLVVHHLPRGESRGTIRLVSRFPEDGGLAAAPGVTPAAFSEFQISPETRMSGPSVANPDRDPRFVSTWSLSPTMLTGASLPLEELPMALAEEDDWVQGEVDPLGRLNVLQYRSPPSGNGPRLVFARVVVSAREEQVKKLNFGFSDVGSVFLNGQVVYTGDNTYLSRSGRYLGVMNIDNDAIFLHLQQGRNELVFAVAENFGGWGLIARFGDLEGIRVFSDR